MEERSADGRQSEHYREKEKGSETVHARHIAMECIRIILHSREKRHKSGGQNLRHRRARHLAPFVSLSIDTKEREIQGADYKSVDLQADRIQHRRREHRKPHAVYLL